MALTLTLKSVEVEGDRVKRVYSIAISGSYANSGTTGDLLDFQGATNSNKLPRAKFARVPDQWKINNQPIGYVARIEPGTTMSTFGLRFFQSDDAVDALDELANGAYPAALTGDSALQIELSSKNI